MHMGGLSLDIYVISLTRNLSGLVLEPIFGRMPIAQSMQRELWVMTKISREPA